jgi:ElaB/YqjD/DUF883 family membrane-anchored ribosome-binding protein
MKKDSDDMNKVIEKIAKLLKLSKSPNEAEAVAAYEKAHALLKEYNLCAEDIHEKPDISAHCVKEYGREMKWKTILMIGVANANYCTMITERRKSGARKQKLYGLEHNVRSAVVMYDYLESVINRCTREESERCRDLRFYTFNANDFRVGMAYRLAERLKEAMERETSECTALAVINTESEKAARLDCGKSLKNRTVGVKESASSAAGYYRGDDISLNRQVAESRAGNGIKQIGGVA